MEKITKNLDLLINCQLFNNLSKEEIKQLLTCIPTQISDYQKNQLLKIEGESQNKIGIVLKGSLHLVFDDYWGNRSILTSIEEFELFGEAFAIVVQKPLSMSIVANSAVQILYLDPQNLLKTCQNFCSFHQQVIQNMLKILSQKNIKLTQKMQCLTQRTTREKIIVYLSNEYLQQKTNNFYLNFNRQQLADYLAVERSALSNELSKMQKQGLLTFQKNHFILHFTKK